MSLTGKNWIAGVPSAQGSATFNAVNPATGEKLPPSFHEATASEIDRAFLEATNAFDNSQKDPAQLASFLDLISEEITALGDNLISLARAETALPEARLIGERARTIGQITMFANLVREGSWVDARIDRALPERKPLPKPDLRRMLIPLGPVVVFAASNFPLAFSVAGGDTISAFAAGNPVVLKAHPAHPGTSELVATAIIRAAERAKLPAGIFSLVHGVSHEVSLAVVRHPATKAVGFTGSLGAGRALFNAAAARPEPIPVYAEMGSTNPVFVLPGALRERASALAEGLLQSVTMGVGQFCTNPGLVLGLADEAFSNLGAQLGSLATKAPPGTMLYRGICDRFQNGVEHFTNTPGVQLVGQGSGATGTGQSAATVFQTTSRVFQEQAHLREELFGPATLLVECGSPTELEQIARALPGQLTATIHGTEEDLKAHSGLISILQNKVGRLLFNGFPTGVEVCPSMHHGGPYPATTDPHYTSVGTAAIARFARPICFQSFPETSLPPELQNKNTRGIWRLVDGQLTKQAL
jgi:alpha-ketoglutaric semialdehyde dehydrogenase